MGSEALAEREEETALSMPSLVPTSGSYLNDTEDEPQSTFDTLSRRKQQFVLFFVKHRNDMTIIQMADELNANQNTLHDWLNDPDVQECILESVRANWKFQGELKLINRFDQLVFEGKDRPEDRKLLAEIYGLAQSGNTFNFNVQTGFADKRINKKGSV